MILYERDFEIMEDRSGYYTARPVGSPRLKPRLGWTAAGIELDLKLWWYWNIWHNDPTFSLHTDLYPLEFIVAVIKLCDFWRDHVSRRAAIEAGRVPATDVG